MRSRHDAPETDDMAVRFDGSPEVRAPLPLRDRGRSHSRWGSLCLPRVRRRGQAARGAGATDPAPGAPRRSARVSGNRFPRSLTPKLLWL